MTATKQITGTKAALVEPNLRMAATGLKYGVTRLDLVSKEVSGAHVDLIDAQYHMERAVGLIEKWAADHGIEMKHAMPT